MTKQRRWGTRRPMPITFLPNVSGWHPLALSRSRSRSRYGCHHCLESCRVSTNSLVPPFVPLSFLILHEGRGDGKVETSPCVSRNPKGLHLYCLVVTWESSTRWVIAVLEGKLGLWGEQTLPDSSYLSLNWENK